MNDPKTTFDEGCQNAFNEEHWQKINYSTGCYEQSFAKGKVNYRNLELEKQRAYTLRNKSMLGLEKLLVDFETHFTDNGGKVLWARNADDALTMIFDLIRKEKANAIMRSNSTVLDEIELNGFLERKNIRVVETQIGRFVLHQAKQKSYHPLSPSIHLSKEENNAILTGNFKLKPDSSVKQMVNFVRHEVAVEAKDVEVCITGANFLLSDSGAVVCRHRACHQSALEQRQSAIRRHRDRCRCRRSDFQGIPVAGICRSSRYGSANGVSLPPRRNG